MEFHHRKLLLPPNNAPYATPLPLLQPLTNSFFPAASTPLPPPKYFSPGLDFISYVVGTYVISILLLMGQYYCSSSPDRDLSLPTGYHSGLSLAARTSSPAPDVPPLSKETIQALPIFPYIEEASYQKDCVICLGEFEEEEAVKMILFCKHIFHPGCLDEWLSSKRTCPLCRSTQIYVDACANGECPEQRSQRRPPQQVVQPGASAQSSPSPTIPTQGIDLSQFQEQGSVHHAARPAVSNEIVPAKGTSVIDLGQFQKQGSVHHCARPASSNEI